MTDQLDRDIAEAMRQIRRLYGEARSRLGLPPRQFVTHVTLSADDMGSPVRYSSHTADRTARVGSGQHSETHHEENTR
jgi:2'-5' RNA ligase